ncbi:hypothetical protein BT63DRAFT_451117 [Microthyrium microscopicum]|uniref:NADH-ubiquinone oxidoreductase 9.5 kDa subunit n=1 Tax=Microthyrium microscopicum TaxID=703497 RepID=A0A6A6UN10_9PEZI|nr:hypothetical protein BT63DRAFT_451117 [Microthyrium microscopicum]
MTMFRASRVLRDSTSAALRHEQIYPRFWSQPFRYMRWAAREKPTFFWSTIFGLAGPVMLLLAPPIKKYYNIQDRPQIPITYPIPVGTRKIPEGFDD